MSEYDVKSRGRSKYRNMDIIKQKRKNESLSQNTLKTSNKETNLPPDKLYIEKRSRTESPPPKSYRRRNGFNRGNYVCCSFCRPEIKKRAYRTSVIRSEIRKCNKMKTVSEFKDIYGPSYCDNSYCCDNGYKSE